jgi:hypothetical protein
MLAEVHVVAQEEQGTPTSTWTLDFQEAPNPASQFDAPDLGIPSTVELRAHHWTRKFNMQRDVASLVCCRSAAPLAIRLRWPSIAIAAIGAGVPVLVGFAVHWANGGLGQFALAYSWPLWLEVWVCVGYWLTVGVQLLWYSSLQRDIAWMALQQFSTMWIIAMTGVYVAGLVSLYEFGVHRSSWISLPVYISLSLLFPLVSMADALPPKLRLRILRFLGPLALGSVAAIVLVLRLPTAEGTPGKLVWTVMGTDTVTNLQALTYSGTVTMVLLIKGVFRAWVFPDRLAFIQTSLCVAELAEGSAPPLERWTGQHALPVVALTARASVAPQPLELIALE